MGACVPASMGAWIRACFRACEGVRVCVRAHKCGGASVSLGARMRACVHVFLRACVRACMRACE